MSSRKSLPAGWCQAPLPYVAEINPPNPTDPPDEDALVSFIPMASVEALSGRIDTSKTRVWREVKKGYTRFQEGDVLFAKITPCMENGKAAIARGLMTGVGAGSTEFHVLRPESALRPEMLLQYLLQEEFRKCARARMTGTAGQLRVPSLFLEEQTIAVPPLPEQHRIVEALESYFTRLDDAVATLERVQRNLKRYRASVLKAAVEGRLVPTEAELARAEGRDLPGPRPGDFFVYAIECGNGEFYVGHTEDLRQSWQEHMAGHACEGTREPGPRRVAHWEVLESRDAALLREKQLKTAAGRKWLRQEIAAGRARQAGYEPASVLLEHIGAEGRDLPGPRPGSYFVYAIECGNGEFYVGHTKDLRQCWQEHLAGHACEGTGEHGPRRVAHWEVLESRDAALLREKQLKTAAGRKLLRQEIAAGRARQAGYEPASVLLRRILVERRRRWEEAELAKMKAQGKAPRDDKWKARYKEPLSVDGDNLPTLPEGWAWASVDLLAEVKGGITKGQKLKQGERSREVPYLRVANVQRGFLDLAEMKTIKASETQIGELRLKPGDVLFNEGGDRDKLGRGWIWKGELPECIHQNHVFRARIYTDDLLPEVLSWYGNTAGQQYFFDEGKQTTNLASVNLTKLRGLPVPVPPSAEQVRIRNSVEEQLSVADAALEAIHSAAVRCARLRQSILKWAFEGRLVDQDPTDEPAAVLLERIRAERPAKLARPSHVSRRTRATRRERT